MNSLHLQNGIYYNFLFLSPSIYSIQFINITLICNNFLKALYKKNAIRCHHMDLKVMKLGCVNMLAINTYDLLDSLFPKGFRQRVAVWELEWKVLVG